MEFLNVIKSSSMLRFQMAISDGIIKWDFMLVLLLEVMVYDG